MIIARGQKKNLNQNAIQHIYISFCCCFSSLFWIVQKKMQRSKSCTCNRISAQRIMTNIFRSVFFLLLFLLFFIFFSSFFLHFSIFISLLRPYKINIGCVLLNRLRKNDGQTLKKWAERIPQTERNTLKMHWCSKWDDDDQLIGISMGSTKKFLWLHFYTHKKNTQQI